MAVLGTPFVTMTVRGLNEAISKIAAGSWQAKTAAKIALNNIAFESMREGQREMETKLHRPTRWTLKSWYVLKKATSQDLSAAVGWSDYLSNKWGQDALHLLAQQWNGGSRNYKRFETRLIRRGYMPSGMYAVPGKAAEELGMIDAYGNLKGSVITAILSSLGTFTEAGYNANATVSQSRKNSDSKMAKRHVYWAGKPGKNTPNGIWAIDDKHSKRGRLRPIIIFVRSPRYRARLDLKKLQDHAVSKFPKEFGAAFDRLTQGNYSKK